ncbi:MAG: AMP-binding protein [Flavobacteriaceae bacterium]
MNFITNIHPSFKLNGLNYEVNQLVEIAKDLEKSGVHYEINIGIFLQQWLNDNEFVLVKTSGSTGTPKEIQLSKQQMINSAKATGVFFKLPEKTTALLCLPSNFIAGKMMLVRAMVLGWDLHIVAPEKDAITQYDNDYDFVAMVPYQVHHSLKSLDKIKKLIIGGGAISEKLNQELQDVNTEVFATYGMTETITHIAVRRINGLAKTNEYTALPNVKFSLNEKDCLVINAPEVSNEEVITNDIVQLNSATTFEYLGRIDNVINSGGVKLFPEQIEAKLSPFINLPFIIASESDEKLGERLILILENDSNEISSNISEAFQNLSSYERPKKIYTFLKFPFTETGKIKRSEVIQILKSNK